MAENVTAEYRQNCYDGDKAQRMVFYSGDVLIANEDLAASSPVQFNLSSCTSTQQIQFGCIPTNTVSLAILNEDRRFSSVNFANREFNSYVGVEMGNTDYKAPVNAISAIETGSLRVSVHNSAPYIRGNAKLGTTMSQLNYGYPCKIMLTYSALYFVAQNGDTRYYAKHSMTGINTFSSYTTPNDGECLMLDRIMAAPFDAIAYYDGGMSEFVYKSNVTATNAKTWNAVKSSTWGTIKDSKWKDFTGYSVFERKRYASLSMGIWHFDRPRNVNVAVLTLSGYDRMTAFDEDSANFISLLADSIMLTPKQIILAIAEYKGVPIGNIDALNQLADEIRVNGKTYYYNKSLKDILSYAFEVSGCNAIIDRRGRLCASSTTNTAIALPYVYSFDVADYTAHTIGKMLIYRQGETSEYETDASVSNGATYDWSDNPFFNTMLLNGSWFSNNLHKKYGGFKNAITVSNSDYSLWCDDVYSWSEEYIEGDGIVFVYYREPIFNMKIEWNGYGRTTYENYGGEKRQYASYASRVEGTSNTNDKNMQGLNKAQFANKLYFDEQGLTVQSNGMRILNSSNQQVFYADNNGNLTLKGHVEASSGTFAGSIEASSGNISVWNIENNGISCAYTDSYNTNHYVKLQPAGYNGALVVGSTGYETSYSDTGITFKEAITGSSAVAGSLTMSADSSTNSRDITLACMNKSGITCTANVRAPNISVSATNNIRVSATNDVTIKGTNIKLDTSNVVKFTGMPSATGSANVRYTSNGLYYISSLRAIKDNIKTIEDATKKVDNLRGVSFTSKCEADDPNKVMYGFIAEEVEEAVPELADYENGKLQGVQYDRVCALLIEDNKACHRRIEALEKRLDELERRLNK